MRVFLQFVSTVLMLACVIGEKEGDTCKVKETGKDGTCLHLSKCPVVAEAITKESAVPQQCGNLMVETVMIVCCPRVLEHQELKPQVLDPQVLDPQVLDPQVLDPQVLDPQVLDPQVLDPQVLDPQVLEVFEGSNCTIDHDGTKIVGKCTPFANCRSAISSIDNGTSLSTLQTCPVKGTHLIVCCKDVETVVEGSDCTFDHDGTKKAGKCTPFANCRSAISSIDNGTSLNTLQTCPVKGTHLIVCCEDVQTVVEGSDCTFDHDGTKKAGKCTPFANCRSAISSIDNGTSLNTLQTCPVKGTHLIVCCEDVETVVEGSDCTFDHDGTKKAGKCTPFANCRSAISSIDNGTSLNTLQTCPVKGTHLIVCCEDVETVVEVGSCKMEHTGSSGECRPLSNCKTAKAAARTGIFPQKCTTSNYVSGLVCCAEPACTRSPRAVVTQRPIGSKAADYCIELAEEIFPCQETSLCQPVPDSNEEYSMTHLTTSDEAPHYGRIGTDANYDVSWQAAPVTLISDRWVVAAASAVQYVGIGCAKFVGLGGSFTLGQYTPDSIYFVSTTVIHPGYNATTTSSRSYNDIALLQLKKRVTFTRRILPACLHTGTLLPESGLIHTGGDGGYAHPDSKTTIRIASEEECSRRFPGRFYCSDGVKHSLQICGFPVKTTLTCGTWSSGSPLYIYNGPRVSCTNLLVGISSTWVDYPCSFIFTRISAYIPWLESIVWP